MKIINNIYIKELKRSACMTIIKTVLIKKKRKKRRKLVTKLRIGDYGLMIEGVCVWGLMPLSAIFGSRFEWWGNQSNRRKP